MGDRPRMTRYRFVSVIQNARSASVVAGSVLDGFEPLPPELGLPVGEGVVVDCPQLTIANNPTMHEMHATVFTVSPTCFRRRCVFESLRHGVRTSALNS